MEVFFNARVRRAAPWALFGLALAYALVAGLRTVSDFDVGWLLATGRYVVTHHQIPRTDVLSYTASNQPWIYPPFGGTLLYLVYAAGGFAALSWAGAFACAATVAVAVGRPRLLTCGLAILAVPSLAYRTAPRADLFTTFFFAAYLALLWKYWREGKGPLWLVPLIMLAWVNTHAGFPVGFALLGLYVGQELLDCCFPLRRLEAVGRLKRAAPWIVLSILVVPINPWGVRVYEVLTTQNRIMKLLFGLGGEWAAVRLTPAAIAGGLQLRDPNSSYWWLLGFGCVAAAVAVYRRQPGNALLLAGAAYMSVEHVRFQAMFGIVVMVVAADVFSRPLVPSKTKMQTLSLAAAAVLIAALGVLHIADTISNRSYLANGELSTFGGGLSWWYPARAAQFIEQNAIPQQLFGSYNSSGFLSLRLGPKYLDFADGRGIPFYPDVLFEQSKLQQSPLDSPVWAQDADAYGINSVVLPLARAGGLELVPLQQDCASRDWRPIYLDDVSIVFVRNRPENQRLIQRFAIDCANYRLVPPFASSSLSSAPLTSASFASASLASSRAPASWSADERARQYNFYANAASIYYVLGRDSEALDAAEHASQMFASDPGLPLVTGQVLEAHGKLAEAEAQYRSSLRIRPTDTGWILLSRLLLGEKRYQDAAVALQNAADLSYYPADRYLQLGNVELTMNQPEKALEAFDRAERFEEKSATLPRHDSFSAQVAEGRGRAWMELHDAKRAAGFLERSAQLAPDRQRWILLADCYSQQGRTTEAEGARNRAEGLPSPR